jgi:glutathione S-transferase
MTDVRLHILATEPENAEKRRAGARPALTLISHHLCPYVQRAVISLHEKQVPFERVYVDLAAKPDWFLKISPLGKVPVLQVGDTSLFESAVILEYLEETLPRPLHPEGPLERARHRAWIEFGSSVLDGIAGLYGALDEDVFGAKARDLRARFARLEQELGDGPYFAGSSFSLVDAVFGPVFRYFDVFDGIGDFGILSDLPRLAAWRQALSARASVRDAAPWDYTERLRAFLERRGGHLASLMTPGVRAVA